MLVEGVLCGFYTNDEEIFIDEPALDAFVRKHIPYYSVPEKWIQVRSIPLTANGKVDRKQLSAATLDRSRADSGIEASQGELKHASIEAALEIQPSETKTREPSQDTEKGKIFVTSQASELEGISDRESVDKAIDILPPVYGPHGLRWLRHRAFILYRRFFSVVVLGNVSVASVILYREARQQEKVLPALAIATASNLVVAVLMRWEPVINLLFTTFCSVPVCEVFAQAGCVLQANSSCQHFRPCSLLLFDATVPEYFILAGYTAAARSRLLCGIVHSP